MLKRVAGEISDTKATFKFTGEGPGMIPTQLEALGLVSGVARVSKKATSF